MSSWTTDGMTTTGSPPCSPKPALPPTSANLRSTLTSGRPSGLLAKAYKYSFHIANEVA
jgi:hypothetical protein